MSDDKNEFQGDVLMVSTADGGDIVIVDGLIKDCRSFDTAVYLSLFGGNKDDLNGKPKETWWGNLIPGTKKDERMHSEFGAMVTGFPLTGANLRKASDAAGRDLDWIKSDAGADEISVNLSAENAQRVKLGVEVRKDAAMIAGGKYELQWQEAVR